MNDILMKGRAIIFLLVLSLFINLILGILYLGVKKKQKQALDNFIGLNDVEFNPIVVSKSDTVKLGNQYIATIYLSYVNKGKLPLVVVSNADEEENASKVLYQDTLSFDNFYETYIYSITPQKLGNYALSGMIVNEFHGKTEKYFFNAKYTVRK